MVSFMPDTELANTGYLSTPLPFTEQCLVLRTVPTEIFIHSEEDKMQILESGAHSNDHPCCR